MAFAEATGIDLNMIPQAGVAGYTVAQVAGGHTDLAVAGLAAAKPQIDAGNLRFLAVIGTKRIPGQYQNVRRYWMSAMMPGGIPLVLCPARPKCRRILQINW